MALPKGWTLVAGAAAFESGQAWVYQVTRGTDGASYALKRLKNRNRSERFRREIETMKWLSSQDLPVPPVIADDLEAERPWFAMPWYQQGSLDRVVRVVSRDDVLYRLELVTAVAEGLSLLHNAGVAHRDIKPSNILLHEGRALLADFGLCMHSQDDARLTDTEEAVGSRLYIAPENESGMSESTDQGPADFYAFGKLAWSVIAGKNPPARELLLSPEHRLDAVVGDARLVGLKPLLAQLLDTDPRVRLADWGVVIAELEAILDLYSVADAKGEISKLDLSRTVSAVSRIADGRGAAAKQEMAARQRIRKEAVQGVGQLLHRELDAELRDDYAHLNSAGYGEMTFSVSTAGFTLATLLEHEELSSFRRSYEPFSLEETSPALAAISWSDERTLDSHFYLGIYVAAKDDLFWLLRIPVMYRHKGKQEVLVQDFVDGLIATSGPLRLGLAGAENAAAAFAQETAQLGGRMAVQLVATIDGKMDPFDSENWLLAG